MKAVARGNLKFTNRPSGAAPLDRATFRAPSAPAFPPRLRQDLLRILREGAELSRQQPEVYEAARLHVSQSGRACHAFIADEFLSRGLAGAMAAAPLVEVLTLTAQSDLAGARALAHRIKAQIDLGLLVYDMVDDKHKFFDLVAPEKALTVTRLFRARRAVAELISLLEGAPVAAQ